MLDMAFWKFEYLSKWLSNNRRGTWKKTVENGPIAYIPWSYKKVSRAQIQTIFFTEYWNQFELVWKNKRTNTFWNMFFRNMFCSPKVLSVGWILIWIKLQGINHQYRHKGRGFISINFSSYCVKKCVKLVFCRKIHENKQVEVYQKKPFWRLLNSSKHVRKSIGKFFRIYSFCSLKHQRGIFQATIFRFS